MKKKIIYLVFTMLIIQVSFGQSAPANVCTSPATYSIDEEVTWYYDLTGNQVVSPGDPVYFFSWSPNSNGGALALEYVRDMIWKLTWTPTEYYQVEASTLTDANFWHNLTTTGNVSVTGTIPYAQKEQLRSGTACNCIVPSETDNKFLVNFTKSTSVIDGADGSGNYWTNVSANNSTFDLVTSDNQGYYQISTSGSFVPNDNSSFLTPTAGNLGELAETNATKSYLYLASGTGTVTLSCLNPDHNYKLSILGSRATASTRETQYTVTGESTLSGIIQTSGSTLGATDCVDCNDDELFIAEVTPDLNREISILVEIISGGYGYINAMMIEEIVPKQDQTITFATPVPVTFGDADFDLGATASSGLPVTYTSLDESVVTISGSTVTIVGAGSVDIVASQAGDVTYNAAPDFTQTLIVNIADQTITFDALPAVTEGDASFDLTATASSGLDVTYTSSNPEVATISGSTVTIVGAGTTDITASQIGNANWNAALDVVQSLTVNPLDQTNYAPSNLTASAVGTEVTLNWEDNSSLESGYRLQVNVNGNGYYTVADLPANSTTGSFTGWWGTHTYTFRVKALSTTTGIGDSEWSAEETISPQESVRALAPTNLTASAVGTEVTLNWEDNSSLESGYRLQVNVNGGGYYTVADLPANSTTGSFTGWWGTQTYTFRVKALSTTTGIGDSEWSAEETISPQESVRALAPTNLTASAVGTEVTLNWEDNSSLESGYRLQVNVNGGGYYTVADLPANSTTGSFTGWWGTQTYTFRVKALSTTTGIGDSEWSAEETISPQESVRALAPTNLTASAVGTEVTLNWEDNSSLESGYRLQVNVNGGGYYTVADLPANSTTGSFTGWWGTQTYTFRVKALSTTTGIGDSEWSAEETISPQESVRALAPTNLTASAVGTEVTLSWEDNSSLESGYRLQVNVNGNGYYTVADLPANSTTGSFTGWWGTHTYTFRVKALSTTTGIGDSEWSAEETISPSEAVKALAPTNLTASSVGTVVTLSWGDNSSVETEYQIQISTDGGSTFFNISSSGANTISHEWQAWGVATYHFRIRAKTTMTNIRNSNWSNVASVTTSFSGARIAEETADIQTEGLSIYPNPTTSYLTIAGEDIQHIKLTDLNGRAMRVDITERSGNYQLDMTTMKQGIYLVEITTEETTKIQKVVKK